jgi:hypothetical protein
MREQLWRGQAPARQWLGQVDGCTPPAANLNVPLRTVGCSSQGSGFPVKVPGEVTATAANSNDDTAV